MQLKQSTLLLFLVVLFNVQLIAQPHSVWTEIQAKKWQANNGWLIGCNYIPHTAANQLEMWQEDTFAPKTINIELEWAEELGFNYLRVFLHHKAWEQDKEGFFQRVEEFLDIAEKHHIKVMLVFFDDCWNATYKIGTQPPPTIGQHNSQWLQDPGGKLTFNKSYWPILEEYVKDVLTHFANDKRIILWDMYNEPGNRGKKEKTLPLLKEAFSWAREISITQPITSGLWKLGLEYDKLNTFQLQNSDIISFHTYGDIDAANEWINLLEKYKRPIVCSEYMCRPKNTFEWMLPLLKKHQIAAVNWGFVSGKTNTIYPWKSIAWPIRAAKGWSKGKEPNPWFHDIFRENGTPYKTEEVEFIKQIINE